MESLLLPAEVPVIADADRKFVDFSEVASFRPQPWPEVRDVRSSALVGRLVGPQALRSIAEAARCEGVKVDADGMDMACRSLANSLSGIVRLTGGASAEGSPLQRLLAERDAFRGDGGCGVVVCEPFTEHLEALTKALADWPMEGFARLKVSVGGEQVRVGKLIAGNDCEQNPTHSVGFCSQEIAAESGLTGSESDCGIEWRKVALAGAVLVGGGLLTSCASTYDGIQQQDELGSSIVIDGSGDSKTISVCDASGYRITVTTGERATIASKPVIVEHDSWITDARRDAECPVDSSQPDNRVTVGPVDRTEVYSVCVDDHREVSAAHGFGGQLRNLGGVEGERRIVDSACRGVDDVETTVDYGNSAAWVALGGLNVAAAIMLGLVSWELLSYRYRR